MIPSLVYKFQMICWRGIKLWSRNLMQDYIGTDVPTWVKLSAPRSKCCQQEQHYKSLVVVIVWYAISVNHHPRCEFESCPGEVYSIHYVIKFVTDLRQVGGFLQVLLISSTNKTEIMLKVVLNTITLTLQITHDLHLMSLRTILNLPPISPCLIYPSASPVLLSVKYNKKKNNFKI